MFTDVAFVPDVVCSAVVFTDLVVRFAATVTAAATAATATAAAPIYVDDVIPRVVAEGVFLLLVVLL